MEKDKQKERFIKVFNLLKKEGMILGVKDFADKIGVKQPNISAIVSGSRTVSAATLNKLLDAFPVSRNYLYDGVGAPLLSSAELQPAVTSGTGVPYYDIDVTGSVITSFSDIQEQPEFFVDFRPFNDCSAYLPIYGDSMYPQFCSGEIVVVKEWRNHGILLWGEPYLIITDEECNNLRTVKLVYPSDKPEHITLRASNPNFKGDTVVPLRCIVNMYIIKGKITRKQL